MKQKVPRGGELRPVPKAGRDLSIPCDNAASCWDDELASQVVKSRLKTDVE